MRSFGILFTALCCVFGASAQAELKLADIFTDGAVLQRDQEIPIWGTETPSAVVSVNFAGHSTSAKVDDKGRWQVRLPAMAASAKPHSLTIASSYADSTGIQLKDILIGEVWLCSGQSNMAMPVIRSSDAETELATADQPTLRVFTVTRKASQQELDECSGEWTISTPETAAKFSATAWFFGREIHQQLKEVPVGLIVAAWSGSAIEAWTSREAQQDQPCLKPLLQSWKEKSAGHSDAIAAAQAADYEAQLAQWIAARNAAKDSGESPPTKPKRPIDPRLHHHHPSVLFNGMIHPIIPYGIRGAIWYQGETNGLTAESAALYERQLPLLINDWRQRWDQGDFPFGFMQLPATRAQKADWPTVREAMHLTRQNVPNTGMAVTYGLTDASLLHPPNKQDFAHRLALWARAEVYGEDIPASGPRPKNYRVDGSQLSVDFSHCEDGLAARGSEAVQGFELRAKNGTWHPAKATIDEQSVRISAEGVKTPIAVRYAWSNHPKDANLVNSDDLPATPFQLGDTKASAKTTPPAAASAKKSSTPPPTDPPLTPVDISTLPDGSEQLDIFLLMGQSNMKGRGIMPARAANDPQIVMMHKKTDEWFVARHPLHLTGDPKTFIGHDNAGVGPGLAFAETLRRHRPATRVALVPCAVGGTRIALWQKGARLYEDTVRRARLALKNGPEGKTRIAGALWLQGEADAKEERIPLYADALAGMIDDLRTDLEVEGLPFLVATIGEMREDVELRKKINLILIDLPNQVAHTAVADVRDLKGHIGDLVHLDTPTQNETGRRFARAWLKMPVNKSTGQSK